MHGFIRETMTLDEKGQKSYHRTYFLDGEEVTLKRYAKAKKYSEVTEYDHRPHVSRPSGDHYRTHRSDALMVHPSQRAEAEEYAKKMGVPTSYGADGRPKINSDQHLRRLGRINKRPGPGGKIGEMIQRNSYL